MGEAVRAGIYAGRHKQRHAGGFYGAGGFGGGPFGPDGPFGPGGPFGGDGPFGGGSFGGGGRGRGGPGGGRRRKRFDGDELRLLMLKLIGDEPRHGYDIIREIESLSGGAYAPSPGLVYPTLTLLADMDLIAEQGEGGARKSYAITDAGKAELDAKSDEVEAVLARLASFAERGGRESAAPALRAMQNLAATVRNKMMHAARSGEMSQEELFKIVEIIDETAQKIERL